MKKRAILAVGSVFIPLKDWPIAGKLLLMVLVPLFLTLVTNLTLTLIGLNRLEAETSIQELQQEVVIMHQQFAEVEANITLTTSELAGNPVVLDAIRLGDLQTLKGMLLSLGFRSDLDYLEIVNTEGQTLAANQNFDLSGASSELKKLHDLGLLDINNATRLTPTSSGWLLVVARSIKLPSGQLLGALSAGRLLDNQTLSSLNFERTNPTLVILDGEGKLIGASEAETESNLAEAFEIDRELWAGAAMGETLLGQGWVRGKFQRVAYAPLVIGDQPAAVFGVALSTEETTALRDQLATINLTVAGVLGLLSILASLFLARNYIIRPVTALAAGAAQIATGQLDVVAPEATNRDELGKLTTAFNNMTRRLQQTLASLANRTQSLETLAVLSERLNAILNLDQLLTEVVNQIKDNFGYHQAHIYLLDDKREKLVMAASSGIAGAEMEAKVYSLLGDMPTNLLIQATRTGQIVRIDPIDGAADSPSSQTYSEMAVPIIAEGQVVGVLNVQENKIGGLDENDTTLLRSIANQVAVALSNARLFEQTARNKEAAEIAKEKAEQARQEAEQAKRATETTNQILEAQIWQTTGQTQLNDKMQGEQDIPTLANGIMHHLCQYLQAQVGTLYLVEDNSLNLIGSYAYSSKRATSQFKFGEGLVGEAAAKQQPLMLTNVPDGYITVRSGLGEASPRHIMIFPFMYVDQVLGVIELGTLAEFTQPQMKFIQIALDSIAIAFNTAQTRAWINELLAETQQQAEELQAQGEELRVANEELAAQTDSLRASEIILRQKQAELEVTNTQLEEQAAALEESSVALRQKQATLDQQNQDLKVAQQELEKKAEELSLASKYKSEFLANMSHELRTPLNSLLILARMLADNKEGNLSEEQVESAQIIYGGGTDLLNLINDILDLSKVEAGKMSFNYEMLLVTELEAMVRSQFAHVAEEKGLALNISLVEDLPATFETDPQRLKQIIKNLLSNAFKFTSAGSVSLKVYRPEAGADLSRSGLESSQAIAISVVDTGIGMTIEQQKIIFEAFQQADGSTSRKYGGTGLGLSICRELVAKMGGQLTVASEPGQGSTFTLYLPINRQAAEPTKVVQPEEPQPKPIPPSLPGVSALLTSSFPTPAPVRLPDDRAKLETNDKIVVIIEDDPKFARIVGDYSHEKGFKYLLATEGKTGLELVKRHQPAAVILDLNLPDISGWEVLEALKNEPSTRHIPVHVISAEDETLEAYRKGVMGYLTKPVNHEGLDEAFQKIEHFMAGQIKALLLVEDDANSRHSIKKLLGGSDVQISEAEQGQAALELLKTHHFDCMILDLSLPDMSGFELLNQINHDETIAKCPVIVYTGRDLSPEENLELMKYADRVIVKGVKSPERLLDETALFLHRVVAEMPEEKQQTIKQLYNKNGLLKDKKILVVDDDMRNSFALSKLLSEKGIIVKLAKDGQKALDLLAQEPGIDLVLMDIMMPVLDGYETTKQIRMQPKFKSLPILALTAKAMKEDREKCLAAGANDYLPKPVDVDRLFSMLHVWLYQ